MPSYLWILTLSWMGRAWLETEKLCFVWVSHLLIDTMPPSRKKEWLCQEKSPYDLCCLHGSGRSWGSFVFSGSQTISSGKRSGAWNTRSLWREFCRSIITCHCLCWTTGLSCWRCCSRCFWQVGNDVRAVHGYAKNEDECFLERHL